MKDTPRTNDIIEQVKGFRTSSAIYSLEQFSRELERELTAVTKQRDEWKAKFIQQNKDLGCEMMDPDGTIWDYAKKLQTELPAVTQQLTKAHETIGTMIDEIGMLQLKDKATTEQRDRLAEALTKIQGVGLLAAKVDELNETIDAIKTQDLAVYNAAWAVVNHWETPLWKDTPPTAEYINKLRNALSLDNSQADRPQV